MRKMLKEMSTVRTFLGLKFIVDAFVALGGEPTKEGTISKSTLI